MTTNRVQNADGVTLDLLGDEVQPRRHRGAPEQAALHEVMRALEHHPAVAWVRRMNSGAARVGDRFIRFGWPGASDLIGMLRDGRLLAVECKAPAGRLRPTQTAFLSLVRQHGGVAIVARSCRDVFAVLGPPGATA